MTIFIRFEAHVSTTYKRALTKKILVRDRSIPHRLTHDRAIGARSSYDEARTNTEAVMRKPRDFDAALTALSDKAKALKENKRQQLGELYATSRACGCSRGPRVRRCWLRRRRSAADMLRGVRKLKVLAGNSIDVGRSSGLDIGWKRRWPVCHARRVQVRHGSILHSCRRSHAIHPDKDAAGT
jgi:hypothetical protein